MSGCDKQGKSEKEQMDLEKQFVIDNADWMQDWDYEANLSETGHMDRAVLIVIIEGFYLDIMILQP